MSAFIYAHTGQENVVFDHSDCVYLLITKKII